MPFRSMPCGTPPQSNRSPSSEAEIQTWSPREFWTSVESGSKALERWKSRAKSRTQVLGKSPLSADQEILDFFELLAGDPLVWALGAHQPIRNQCFSLAAAADSQFLYLRYPAGGVPGKCPRKSPGADVRLSGSLGRSAKPLSGSAPREFRSSSRDQTVRRSPSEIAVSAGR